MPLWTQGQAAQQRYMGLTEEVLVEGINPKDPSQLMGRTRTNRRNFLAQRAMASTTSYPCGSIACGPFHSADVLKPSQRW